MICRQALSALIFTRRPSGLSVTEETIRQSLVDDRDRRTRRLVRLRECAAGFERNTHRREVTGGGPPQVRAIWCRLDDGTSLDEQAETQQPILSGERKRTAGASGLNARQQPDGVERSGEERRAAVLRIARRGKIDVGQQGSSALEADVDGEETA